MPEIVKGPDGREYDVEGAPPEVRQAMFKSFQQQAAAMPAPPSKLESFGREAMTYGADLLRGAGRAASSIIEGAGNAGITNSAVDLLGLPKPKGMTASPATDAVNSALPTPENDAVWRKYLRAGLEGGAGGVVTGLNAPNIVGGISASLAEQGARQVAPNNPIAQTGAALLGGVVGGGGAAVLSRARPQTAALAKEALEGIKPEELQIAQDYMNRMAAAKTPIDLAQALVATRGNAGTLGSVRDAIAGRTQGDKLTELLRTQPQTLRMEAQQTVAGMPGTNWSPTSDANFLQETAEKTIKMAKADRKAIVDKLYDKAGDMPDGTRQQLGAILNDFATRPGTTEVMKAKAAEFGKKLMGKDPKFDEAIEAAKAGITGAKTRSEAIAAQQALAAANAAKATAATAPLHASDVNVWISELAGPFKGQSLKVAYPQEAGQVKGLAGALNKKFQDLSPEVKAAEAKFAEITEGTVNPLKKGPVGILNQPGGVDPTTQAQVSRFDGLMNRGTDPEAKISDIAKAARELSRANPDAFESAFKGWLSGKLRPATSTATSGTPLGEADPSKLYRALFEDTHTWQGIKDAAYTMAEVRGVDKDVYMRGLENLKQLTKAMTSRTAPTGMSPEDLKRLGGSSTTADFVRLASFLPMNRVGERIERATLGKTLSQFDTILTSPEGAKMLVELGKTPVMSRKAQVLLGTFGGMVGNSGELPENNPPD